jgi:L-alanine-DL-glutamate epimerase-like enolase superfamily enzyme
MEMVRALKKNLKIKFVFDLNEAYVTSEAINICLKNYKYKKTYKIYVYVSKSHSCVSKSHL